MITFSSSNRSRGDGRRPLSVSLKSDKVKGSFCASAPDAFIRQNTVYGLEVSIVVTGPTQLMSCGISG